MQYENYYHLGEAWLAWCNDHIDEIKAEYLRRIQSQESTRDFFGDLNTVMGHSDIGYYLGAQFIRYMLSRYTLTEVAVFQDERLINEYEEYARS